MIATNTTEKEEYYIITMRSQMVHGPFKSIREVQKMMTFYKIAYDGEYMVAVKRVLDSEQI